MVTHRAVLRDAVEVAMFRLSLALFGTLGLVLTALGVLYLSASQFMPYHSQALQVDWSALPPHNQALFLGFLKGLGAGALMVGLAIIYMAGASLVRDPQPFLVLLPITSIGYLSLLCYATYTVAANTAGEPPLTPTIFGVFVAAGATLLLMRSRHAESIH